VTFLDGKTVLGSEPLNASGQATLSTSRLEPGAQGAVTAVYGGDANYHKSTSSVPWGR
jgi:hypothetical protein